MEQDDPADWSIDRVIQEICYTQSPGWATSVNFRPIVNPEVVERALRGNDIDGDNLLALEDNDIKQDLGLTSFGQRRQLRNLIALLRLRSSSYQAHLPPPGTNMLFSSQPSHAIVTPQSRSRAQRTFSDRDTTQHLVDQSEAKLGKRKYQDKDVRTNGSHGPTIWKGNKQLSHPPATRAGHHVEPDSDSPAGVTTMPSRESRDNGIGLARVNSACSGRDSLNPSGLAYGPQSTMIKDMKGSASTPQSVDKAHQHRRSPPAKPAKRARLIPISPETISAIRANSSSYSTNLCDVGIVEDLHTNTRANRDDAPHNESWSSTETGAIDRNTSLLHGPNDKTAIKLPRRRAVRKDLTLVKKRQKVIQPVPAMTHDTSDVFTFLAVKPARSRMRRGVIFKKRSQEDWDRPMGPMSLSASTTEARGEILSRSREAVSHTNFEWSQVNPLSDLHPELQSLLEKYPTQDETAPSLPLYGDSDEEDRVWTSESEASTMASQDAKKILTREEIDTIVNQCVEQFKVDWHSRHLVQAQRRARKLWLNAAKARFLHTSLLNEKKMWQNKFGRRIQQFRNGIYLSDWHKVDDVKQQCLAMEVSVHQHEEYTLYVNVLTAEQEPSIPVQAKRERGPKLRPRIIMSNGDEDLESDDSDGFLVVDDDQFPTNVEEGNAWQPQCTQKSHVMPQGQAEASRSKIVEPEAIFDSIEEPLIAPGLDPWQRTDSALDNAPNGHVEAIIIDSPPLSQAQQKSIKRHVAIDSTARNPRSVRHLTESSENQSDHDSTSPTPAVKRSKLDKPEVAVFDLTGSSPPSGSPRDSSIEVLTSEFGKVKPSSFSTGGDSSRQYNPPSSSDLGHRRRRPSTLMDIRRIERMQWEDIEPRNESQSPDSRLALAKAVYSLGMDDGYKLLDYLRSVDNLKELLEDGLDAVAEGEFEISNVSRKNQENARTITSLLVCYANGCRMHVFDEYLDTHVEKASLLLENNVPDFRRLLESLLQNRIQYVESVLRYSEPSSSDTSDELGPNRVGTRANGDTTSTFRGRKQKVEVSRDIVAQQNYDRRVAEEQERRRANLLKQQSRQGVAQDKLSVAISISEPLVCLDSKHAAIVKPHQIDGIRFMWREVVENPRSQGCLLAHTMGLGKTMQVILLLALIVQCNTHESAAMRRHIPKHLRAQPHLRIMILCPVALIDNWCEELLKWLPNPMMLGVITKLDSYIKVPEVTIRGWYETGGVLIIGYEKFAKFVNHTDLPERRRMLIEGPDLVIADEAHKLKNAAAKVNAAAKLIQTTSRIALTGSPLNNYLEEYHTMIDWISPGYLGTMVQFKAKYVEPITHGLYSESESWDRKRSMKKLHVLKCIIAPKINRADITAISKDLPPKVEFFLTVPLTDDQTQAYRLYIRDLRSTSSHHNTKIGNTTVWKWLNMLSLLLNHPSCFVERLQHPESTNANPVAFLAGSEDDNDSTGAADDVTDSVSLVQQPALATAMEKVTDVFAEAGVLLGMDDPSLSYKTLLVKHILEEAVRVDEKTLIFSNSIRTLNYYEDMVRSMGLGYKRIDGSQNMAGSRQRVVDEFNQSLTLKVFLISTRAGGLGLNIQSATRVIINDFHFNPSWEEQAVGRAYRLGQTKPVFVYRFLVGGTFEELIHNTAIFKTQLFTRVVDEKNVISHAKKRAGEFLFDPKEVPQKEFSECLGKDPDVLDRVLRKVDCVRDVFLTETFYQDAGEELNEQELKEANEDLQMEQMEQLERENPEEFRRRLQEQHMRTIKGDRRQSGIAAAAAAAATTTSTQPATNTFSTFAPPRFVGPRHFLDLTVPTPTNTSVPDATGERYYPAMSSFTDEFVSAGRAGNRHEP